VRSVETTRDRRFTEKAVGVTTLPGSGRLDDLERPAMLGEEVLHLVDRADPTSSELAE
jgi:hypothetical protein